MRKSPEQAPKQLPLCKSSRPLRLLKNQAEPVSSNEIWLLTLSDLLMLLMIFLVFLLAVPFAQTSAAKPSTQAVAEKQSPPPAVERESVKPAEEADVRATAELEKDLQAALGNREGGQGVTIERRPHAVIITFPEQILFDSGEARLKQAAEPTLGALATFIVNHPELAMEVQGHTDNRPIQSSRYPSNWELSADRATQVAKALVQRGANPTMIATKGLGEFHPVAPNDSDEGRLKNRRVEIQFSL